MISRTVLRILTLLALEEAAFAKGRVFDTMFSPFDKSVFDDGNRKPFAVVYTETTKVPLDGGRPTVELVIDWVAGAYELQPIEGGVNVYPASDAAAEMSCDVRGQYILNTFSQLSCGWAGLLRRFAKMQSDFEIICGADDRNTHKATRRLKVNVSPLKEPEQGACLVGVWLDVVEGFEAHELPAIKAVGALVRAVLEGRERSADWVAVEDFGLSREEVKILGFNYADDWDRTKPAAPVTPPKPRR